MLVYQKSVDFADDVCTATEQFARGSVQKCVPLLELARRRNLIQDIKHAELKPQLEGISKVLAS